MHTTLAQFSSIKAQLPCKFLYDFLIFFWDFLLGLKMHSEWRWHHSCIMISSWHVSTNNNLQFFDFTTVITIIWAKNFRNVPRFVKDVHVTEHCWSHFFLGHSVTVYVAHLDSRMCIVARRKNLARSHSPHFSLTNVCFRFADSFGDKLT